MPWGLRVSAEVAWRLVVVAAAVWVLLQVIGSLRVVVLSFAASLLVAALLQPTVGWLRRHRVPRVLAALLTFIGGLAVMTLVGWFVYWQVNENIDTLTSNVQGAVKQTQHWLTHGPLNLTETQISDFSKQITQAIGTNSERITDVGVTGVTVAVELLTGVALAAFSSFFLIYDGERIWNWLLKLFPPIARRPLAGAGPRAWTTLTGYIRGTVIVAFIDALSIGVGIALLQVPLALPLAVLVFLGAFIPLVGALISGSLAVAVGLVTQGPFTALLVLAVVVAVMQIEGHLLQPLILGRAVRVHPLAVILSVACGSLLAGIGGAVVAVPLVAVVNTVVSYLVHYHGSGARTLPAEQDASGPGARAAPDPDPDTTTSTDTTASTEAGEHESVQPPDRHPTHQPSPGSPAPDTDDTSPPESQDERQQDD